MASKRSCSMCLDSVDEPKPMPCLHIFREKCVNEVINTHSDLDKLSCLICSDEIELPEGGASQVVEDFCLEDDDGGDQLYCSEHETKEIEVYCNHCQLPCCSDCVNIDHKNHTFLNLDAAETDLRETFLKLKTASEIKLKQLQEHSNYLKANLSEVNNSCKRACANVDKQVDLIHEKAKRMAGGIKDEILQLQNEQNIKITKLIEDVDNVASILKEWYEYSDCVLQPKSIFTTFDPCTLLEVKNTADFDISDNLHRPVISHPYYQLVEIPKEPLKTLMGELLTITSNLISTFDLKQVKTDSLYCGEEFMTQGMPWCVEVKHFKGTSSLGIYLALKKSDDKTDKSFKARFTLELLNLADDNKTVVKEHTYKFTPGGPGYGSYNHIDWDIFTDSKSGFLDKNNKFIVQSSIYITE